MGDTGVTRIMLGSEQVWPYIEPPTPLIDGQRYIFYASDSSLQTYFGWTNQVQFPGGMTQTMITGWSGDSVNDSYYWVGGMLVVTAVTSGSGSYFTWISENQLDLGTQYYYTIGQATSGNSQLYLLHATTSITEAELFGTDDEGHLISCNRFEDYVPLRLYCSVALPDHDTATASMGTADMINKNPNYRELNAFILKYSGNARNDGSANPIPWS